jgi:hypothetical protein
MSRSGNSWAVIGLLAIAAVGGLVFYWYYEASREPAAAPAAEPPGPAEVRRRPGPIYPLEPIATGEDTARNLVPLPTLDDSDGYFRLELVNIYGSRLDELLGREALIEKFVATIDNLPRSHVAERLRPVGSIAGPFLVETDGDVTIISPENFERYAFLADLFVNADMDAIEDVYRRYYPLFQQAYVALGYPNGYFNDRVVEVIDHLLTTPSPAEPLQLSRPHVLYELADPDLEALSSGQKLLLRMGDSNATKVKDALARLRERIATSGSGGGDAG